MRWLELLAGNSQSVVFKRSIRSDNPTRQYGEPYFDVGYRYLAEVKPLAARIGTRKLLGEKLTATRKCFPRDVTW